MYLDDEKQGFASEKYLKFRTRLFTSQSVAHLGSTWRAHGGLLCFVGVIILTLVEEGDPTQTDAYLSERETVPHGFLALLPCVSL